jgi:spermidine/putrescine-binding protein
MAPHIGYLFQGEGAMTSAMASGDLVAMAPSGATVAFAAYQSGAPVRFKVLGGAAPLTDNDLIVVLKGPNQKEALEFVNYCLSAGPDSILARIDGNFPTNPQSTISPDSVNFLGISPSSIYTSAYVPDWAYVNSQYSNWETEWTSKVLPLINTS